MKIDVIIPVYRPTEKLHKVLYRLCRQTHLPEQIILLHTRDGIKLDVSVCKDRVSVTEIPILEKEFDHGRTREQGIWMSDADIVVMMTQDAVPADPFLLEKLSEVLNEHPDAVAAYARQIPDQNCGLLEKYTRVFNYPPKSQIKSQKDLPKLGIKTYFCPMCVLPIGEESIWNWEDFRIRSSSMKIWSLQQEQFKMDGRLFIKQMHG